MKTWSGGTLALIALSVGPALGWEHWGRRPWRLSLCAITNVGRLIEAWRGARRGRDLHPTLVGGEVHREPIAGAKTAHGQGNLGAYGVEFGERLADLA